MTTMETMHHYFWKFHEDLVNWRLPACSAYAEKRIDQMCLIFDFEGFSVNTFNSQCLELTRWGSKTGQDNYPELMHKTFIVNAPYYFKVFWAIIKHFYDENVLAKISIMGSDFKEVLLGEINAEVLPSFFGGNCTCEEFGGRCDLSDIGPWQDYHFERPRKMTHKSL